MSFEGMDVDKLEALAKQLDADAQALYNLVNRLNELAAGLVFLWYGPVSVAFEQDWQLKDRPALLAAHNILTNLHSHLVSNINQQKSASDTDGWTLDRVLHDVAGGVHTAWDIWEFGAKPAALIDFLPDNIHKIASDAYDPGARAYHEYNKAWNGLIKLDHEGSFFKYHESTVLRYIHDSSRVQRFDKFMINKPIGDLPGISLIHDFSYLQKADKVLARTHIADILPGVGLILSAPDAIANLGEAAVDLKNHRYNSAIQHLGTVAEDEGGVVGLLAGGTVKLLAEEYELGKQMGQPHQPLNLGQEIGQQFGLLWKAFLG